MKVLHVSPNLSTAYGGPTYSLLAYARAALDAGIDITIVGAGDESDRSWLATQLPNAEVLAFPAHGRGAFVFSPSLARWLPDATPRYDVVHVHGLLNPISSLAARSCTIAGRPTVIRPYGTLSRYTFAHRRRMLKRAFFRTVDRPNLRHARAIHFTTEQEREESDWRGIEWGDRAFIIPPPWVNGSGACSRVSDASLVVMLSRINPVKNIEIVIDAWPAIQASVPRARLVIAGDGQPEYIRALRDRASRQGGAIEFRGFVTGAEKAELLASSALFVLPSFHENFGVAVLEALAAGLPVIVTREVQLSSFVLEHSLGIVPERSIGAIATAVISALGNTELRERSRTHGPALVQQHFSSHVAGEKLMEMYRFAAAPSSSSSSDS